MSNKTTMFDKYKGLIVGGVITLSVSSVSGAAVMIWRHESFLTSNTAAIERIEPKLNKVHDDVIKLKERDEFGERDSEKLNQRLEDVGKDVSQIKADIQTMKAILERTR